MNDRFKFRVVYYNDVEKKYFIFEPDLISADGTARAYAYGESGADEYYDTVTLNQCTGLKDENGKLIYEGDIVKDISLNIIFEVGYKKCAFYLENEEHIGYFHELAIAYSEKRLEVIGNIYENKELLESEG